LLWKSLDGGESWTAVNNISHLPPSLVASRLVDVVCQQDSCVAIGFYYDRATWKSILLTSLDRGENWSFNTNYLNYRSVDLRAVSCLADRCLLMAQDDNMPRAYVSKDKAATWQLLDV